MHVPRLILVGALGCLVGCGFQSGEAHIDASPPAPDAPPDAAPCVPWDALNLSPTVTPCDKALGVRVDLALPAGAYTLDTDSGQLSGDMTAKLPGALIPQPSSSLILRIVNLGQFMIASGATVSVTGTHPLVFVVHGDATIAGAIDVSARVDIAGTSTAGPGADDAVDCQMGFGAVGQGGTGTGGAGGAGGGGFGDTGSDGGDGGGAGHGMHGVHGNATGDPTIVPLRGGCPGGQGGATSSSAGGRAGNGGGAVEVTALGTIDVTGTGMLKAAGSGGGTPGLLNAGGGAGGSGGAILLDGNTVQVEASGALCANGGAGGEGGGGVSTNGSGENGTCSATQAARGGTGNSTGGDGGDGGRLKATAGQPGGAGNGGAAGGGGAGGGGVGRIRVHGRPVVAIDGSAIVSPAAAP